LKLLIADDEPGLRLLVAATLVSEDYAILEAANGLDALAIVRAEQPRLVLLDVQMPGMDGLEACRQIKADPVLAGTVVVMLTSLDQPEDEEAGRAAGADTYLTKPFSPLDLLQVVEGAMSHR
jgi:CheY-like chemotaxis protein